MSNYFTSSRTLELRLLHNYTAMTSKTLVSVNTPAAEQTWSIDVPNMAFEVPCLMDMVLATSALHLRALNPNDQTLVRASHGYMASALSQYSATLINGVDASNAEALFATSALIAFQASASRRFQDDDGGPGTGQKKYQLPLQWFHAFQGVKAVVLASWRWLRDSERVRPIITGQTALALDLKATKSAFFGPLLEGMDEKLLEIDECERAETRQGYEHSVAYLNWSHLKPERARILGFPATVSRRFVELIEQEDPRALVIIACFFAMTKAVDDVWWLQGVAKREVSGIMSLLPEEWWPKMDWAMNVANREDLMDEAIWGDCWHSEGTPQADQGFNGDMLSHIDILARMHSVMPEPDVSY
ncbi:MAG: hypothetical protein M1818_000799 [Claussenomyces sp. TS43310]|nr:MAG: hypothetical protein M1818_000799 [Claussenomyces sp. TS43310]